MSAPAPPQPGQSLSATPADTETSGGEENNNNIGGLDVTLLVFIIIIALLVLGLTILLLVYWCCRPGRQQAQSVILSRSRMRSYDGIQPYMETTLV